jgi:hypothetical protein
MLIPIGFFGGGGSAGAYEQIATAFGTGSSATITFDSIPQDYKHLQIRYAAKTTDSAYGLNVRYNNISTAGTYNIHYLRGNGSAVSSAANTGNSNEMRLPFAMANKDVALVPSSGIIDILDYASTTKNKTLRAFYGMHFVFAGNYYYTTLASGLSLSTSAVSSIQLIVGGSGNFSTVSRFSLYGIKG